MSRRTTSASRETTPLRGAQGCRIAALGLAALAALAFASPAQGAVTVGSQLGVFGTSNQGCFGADGPGCVTTVVQQHIGGVDQASPISGVIVRWRVRNSSETLRLRVLHRNLPGDSWTGAGTGETVDVPPGDVVREFPARLPIAAGDYVAVDVVGDPTPFLKSTMNPTTDLAHLFGHPGLPDGTTDTTTEHPDFEYLYNADIEPDADGDGFGDETQDGCPGETGPEGGCPPTGDTVSPDTTISQRPKDKTKKKTATFEFSGTDARAIAGFECSLDGAAFTSCASPFTVKVKKGKHDFSVRATDAAGNVDGSPATDDWKVKKKKKK